MSKWPKTSNDNGLMFLRNHLFHMFYNVSWHSNRDFPQVHSVRYRVLNAVCTGNIEDLESCLKEGWDINAPIDFDQRYNAASLAAHLDRLEMLHYLDLRGANLSNGAGKVGNTPLMTGMMNWNVRVIDYLTERGVDPYVTDKYGFTALKKAQIKNLRTISSMLTAYEKKYEALQHASKEKRESEIINPITSKEWE